MWLIFRIFLNLFYKLYYLLFIPAYLLFRRSFGLIIIIALGYGLVQLFSGSDDATRAKATDMADAPVPLVQIVTRREDGNSKFAQDLLTRMSPEELSFYSQTFYWVMNHQPAGEPHVWHYFNTHGQLTPKKSFKNNHGTECRRFSEVLKVHDTEQTLDGIACRRDAMSWCKLGKNYTPICGIASRRGIGGWFEDAIGDLF